MSNRNNTFIGYQLVVVGPGQVDEKRVQGSRVVFTEATDSFYVRLGNLAEVPANKGFQFGLEGGEQFNSISIRNPSESDTITVAYYYGTATFVDARLNVINPVVSVTQVGQDAPTLFTGQDIGQMLPGASALFSATAPANCIRRKAIIITNGHAEAALLVRTSDEVTAAAWVLPNSQMILETSDAVALYNDTTETIPCQVGELWYTVYSEP